VESSAEDVKSLKAENERLRRDLQNALLQLSELKRHVFGRKTEKLSVISTAQTQLFEFKLPEVEDTEETEVKSHQCKRRKSRKLPEDLPRKRVEYAPEETTCKACGEELKKIGEDITEELEYQPAQFFIREHVRIKCACPKCKENVVAGKLPADAQVLEKARCGAGLLAYILVSKYCDHQPLYRLEKIFARYGVSLSRSTMCDWVGRACETLLFPIAAALKRQVMTEEIIFADETHLEVQTGEKQGLHKGYLWGALGPPGVYFHYSASRATAAAKELLGEFEGYIHTDAYAGYNEIFLPESCIRVACWAHVRRRFREVQKLSPKEVNNVLQLIAKMYAVEKKVKRLEPEARLKARKKSTLPVLENLKTYLDALNETTLPSHPLKEKAINYALKFWNELSRFTTDGRLEIDNNPIEREIKPIALGRKNYLFCGSERGAKWAATLYSLINSCELLKVNPYEYLRDVLRRANTHPANRVDELTPLGWKQYRI